MTALALITGASGGIGSAIVRQLASNGFEPILVARSAAPLDRLATELGPIFGGKHAQVLPCDVSDPDAVQQLFDHVAARGRPLKVLVNGAGISGGGITAQVSNDLWHSVMASNVNSMFYTCRDALQRKLIVQGGRIINIASTGGKQGVLHGAPYCASKHAMVGFTKALGLELARNGSRITVNAVCPGFVETEMAERVRAHYGELWKTGAAETRRRIEERVPIGRYIETEEVAAMVSYLASPAASGVTAQALNVCGGLGNY